MMKLEEIAKAMIFAAKYECVNLPGYGPRDVVSNWMEIARVTVEAMREPGPEAIEIGNTVSENAGDIWEPSEGISFNGPQCGLEVWQAMIDAILKEKPTA